jgi:hypothetical protein
VEWKPLVGPLAAIFAEHKSREAVRTPPLKRSRHAGPAHCHSRNTLSAEDAIQVGSNPRNKFLHVSVLGLGDGSNTAREERTGELTHFFFEGDNRLSGLIQPCLRVIDIHKYRRVFMQRLFIDVHLASGLSWSLIIWQTF